MRTREQIEQRIVELRHEQAETEDGLEVMIISAEIKGLEWVLAGEVA